MSGANGSEGTHHQRNKAPADVRPMLHFREIILLLLVLLLPSAATSTSTQRRQNQHSYVALAITRHDHRLLSSLLERDPTLAAGHVAGESLLQLAAQHGNPRAAKLLRRAARVRYSIPNATSSVQTGHDEDSMRILTEKWHGGSFSQAHVVNTTFRDVITVPGAFTVAECNGLIELVEEEVLLRGLKPDTVGSLPEYQVKLGTLRKMLEHGVNATRFVDKVWSKIRQLPRSVSDSRVHGEAPWDDAMVQVFVRKYSADTRASLELHKDESEYTINVALNGRNEYVGGDLVALIKQDGDANVQEQGGKHERTQVEFVRGRGTATIHGGDLAHSVTSTLQGVRYTLIIFAFKAR